MILDQNHPIFWDIRLHESHLRRGRLTEEDLQAYLDRLPDTSEKAVLLSEAEEVFPANNSPYEEFSSFEDHTQSSRNSYTSFFSDNYDSSLNSSHKDSNQ